MEPNSLNVSVQVGQVEKPGSEGSGRWNRRRWPVLDILRCFALDSDRVLRRLTLHRPRPAGCQRKPWFRGLRRKPRPRRSSRQLPVTDTDARRRRRRAPVRPLDEPRRRLWRRRDGVEILILKILGNGRELICRRRLRLTRWEECLLLRRLAIDDDARAGA